MIIFSGNIQSECQNYIRKGEKSLVRTCCIVVSMVILAFTGIMFFAIGSVYPLAWLFLIVGVIFIVLFNCFACFKLQNKRNQDDIFYTVEIANDVLTAYFDQGSMTREFQDIKSVVDKGTFYIINFYFPHAQMLCEKDLIVQGTLEEFEELFEDYLIKQ